MLGSDLRGAVLLPWAVLKRRIRFCLTPQQNRSKAQRAAALALLVRWRVRCPSSQRWQVRMLLRARPGLRPWLSMRSRPGSSSEVARLLPQAPRGPFEERALAGQGQPRIACPKSAPRGEQQFSPGVSGASPASLAERAVLVRPGPWQLRAFSLCAGRWRAAVYAPKNRLRAFWSRGG